MLGHVAYEAGQRPADRSDDPRFGTRRALDAIRFSPQ
jgi:hypothetical protein